MGRKPHNSGLKEKGGMKQSAPLSPRSLVKERSQRAVSGE